MTADRYRKKIAIVIPVYNDWEALGQLISQLGERAQLSSYDVYVLAIDDGSSQLPDADALKACKGVLLDIQVVRLACNLGHQRAIAIGLVVANTAADLDAVVVMDSDGEDQPDDVARLIAAWDKHPGSIVVARRGRRSEGFLFKLFYFIYKLIFRIMTGHSINFGNFILAPRYALQALIHNPAIWNNLAAAITRSRIPYSTLTVDRGPRLAGISSMNFMNLAVHGLSAISVYTDIVLVRIVVAASALAAVVFLGLLSVIAIKFGTDWAIPGWASYVGASLTIVFIQALLLAGLALFQLLSLRSLKPFVPASDASVFIVEAAQDLNLERPSYWLHPSKRVHDVCLNEQCATTPEIQRSA